MDMSYISKQLARLERADNVGIELSDSIRNWSKDNLDTLQKIDADAKGWTIKLVVAKEPPYKKWSMIFSHANISVPPEVFNPVFKNGLC